MWGTDNVFLDGPYAPWREEGQAFNLDIHGGVPRGLNGVLYLIGPNQHFRPRDPARHHWFDGDGMVHAIFLRDGHAWYRNRYVMTSGLSRELKHGRALYGSGINGHLMNRSAGAAPGLKSPANASIELYNGRLLVCGEVGLPYELRPDTLETLGQCDFNGRIAGSVGAHAKYDPDSGELLLFGIGGQTLNWYEFSHSGALRRSHTFDMGVPSYIHDYGLTSDYAVFVISPAMMRPTNAARGWPVLTWEPDTLSATRFALLHRASGIVQFIDDTDVFAVTHILNMYRFDDVLIIDGHRVPRWGIDEDDLETPPAGGDWNKWFTDLAAAPWRWNLNLKTGTVSGRQTSDVLGEFPRLNQRCRGRQHRFGYYATTRWIGHWPTDGLAKHDYQRNITEVFTLGSPDAFTAPSEAVFVPRPYATAEDDGWLLSIWWEPYVDRSHLIIQDSQDFTGTPLATVELNHRIPITSHGSWVSGEEYDAALSMSSGGLLP